MKPIAYMVLAACIAAPALPQTSMVPPPAGTSSIGSSASITVGSGPHKGKYDFAPTEACVITAFSKKPLGLSVVFTSESASMSVDMPNIDDKHANEIQVVLVVSDAKPGESRKGASSVTYEVDTRPDAVLEPFQKAERANKGMSGKATTTQMQDGARVLLNFSGETALGVKLIGELTCQRT